MSKKILYPLLVFALAVLAAIILLFTRPQLAADTTQRVLSNVRVMNVTAGNEYLQIKSQGTVQPRTESQLISEVSGPVVELSAAMVSGGSFTAGELLLRIDPVDYEAAVSRRKAALDRAAVELEHAMDELHRFEKLQSQKLASQSQLDDVRRSSRVAKANYDEATIDLESAERDLQRTAIYAPFSGRVREEHVDVGQFVSRGGDIGTIYATDYVEIRLPVASSQLRYLDLSLDEQGQLLPERTVNVTITGTYGDVEFSWVGKIVRTEAEIDARTRMLYGVAMVENRPDDSQPPLLVGLYVNASIQGREVQNVVRLPRSAMRDDSQVLVVAEDNRLHFRKVEVLRIEHDEVVIQEGLESGERVCLSPLQAVVDGMEVNPVIASEKG